MSRFWNAPHNAGPTLWDMARFWDRQPRPLRPQNRPRPPPFQTWSEPLRLGPADAEAIAAFWRRHYGGTDWWLDATAEWVRALLAEPDCWMLGVQDPQNGNLIATLVCRSALPEGGGFHVGPSVTLDTAYIIEGLCVAPEWRGHHLAGWLIAWIDYLRNQTGPHLFIWSRETRIPTYQTNITCDTYAYASIVDLMAQDLLSAGGTGTTNMVPVNISAFRQAWEASVETWKDPFTLVPTVLPWGQDQDIPRAARDLSVAGCEQRARDQSVAKQSFASDIRVFRHVRTGQTVVFADTHRCTRGDHPQRIWEVVWCGVWEEGSKNHLRLPKEGDDFQACIGNAALHLGEEGLVFVTSAPHQGGCTAAWRYPWVFGRSGYHTSYLYNFLPPAFWTCRLLLPRNEV